MGGCLFKFVGVILVVGGVFGVLMELVVVLIEVIVPRPLSSIDAALQILR